MKKSLLYFVIFAAIQMIAGGIVMFAYQMIKGKGSELDATGMILTTVLTDVATLVCFLWPKWAELSPNWLRKRYWDVCFWCVLAACGAIIPSMYIQELMPELPNLAEHQLELVMSSPFGYVVLGLMAPLVEEIVFRGAILSALHRHPHESCSDASRLPDRDIARMDVLPHRQHPSRSDLPLCEQFDSLSDVCLLSRSKHQDNRCLWRF